MEDQRIVARRPRALLLWLAVLVVVLSIAGVVFAARKPAASSASKNASKKKDAKTEVTAAPVELTPVRTGGISTWLQTTTTLEPRHTAMLVARRQGQVMNLKAEEGSWVERGGVLASLDSREERLAVEHFEVALDVAKRELERGRQLSEKGYLSARELDDLDLKTRTARIELDRARLALSDMRILAPFSGRVTERLIQLGETVTAGKECFRLVDFHPVLARLYFPERELARVRVGQTALVTTEAQPGREIPARVTLVNPTVDRSNGTFKVTLEIPNLSGELRPGAFARIRLRTGEFATATLMPRRGLLNEDGESYVFVARGDSVQRIAVRVGAVEGETAQILTGLAAGDRVVTVGQGGLKPGAKIKPVQL